MDWGQIIQNFWQDVILFIPRLLAALVVFGASLLLSGLASRWTEHMAKSKVSDPETRLLLCRVTRWGVVLLGTLLALDLVDFNITGFVAGLGLAGLTVGFALQDIARNFVAGILLLIRQPFEIGNAVKIGEYSGTVLAIHARDTMIKTWDGEIVIVPNIDVFSSAIVNYSEYPLRRRTVRIGLGYGQDVMRARRIFLEAIRQVEGVLPEPAPSVHAEDLGDSTLVLAARFWLDQRTHSLFEVHSLAVQSIVEAADREGIELPYPIQTVRLEGEK